MYKLTKLLKRWGFKYSPVDYDGVIEKAFALINTFELKAGKASMNFDIPKNQLSEEFIAKFFAAASNNGYITISYPSKNADYLIFKLTK